jgi:hypothetical protein
MAYFGPWSVTAGRLRPIARGVVGSSVWCGLALLLAATIGGQVRAADPPAAAFAAREVTPGWTLVQIGNGEQRRFTSPLQATFEGGDFTLQADSGALFFKRSDDPDGIGLVHSPLEGDGSIVAKVTRFENFHHWGGAGVMVREENTPLGRYMCAMLEPIHAKGQQADGEHAMAASIRMRRQVGPEGFRVQMPDRVTLPVWLKVERHGQQVSGFYSPDGKEWKLLKEAEIPMGAKVQVGLTAWSRYGIKGTATFEDVEVRSGR